MAKGERRKGIGTKGRNGGKGGGLRDAVAEGGDGRVAEVRGSRDWAVTLGTALLAILVYALTLAPSVVGGDAGELVVASATGGVPHPPGYPLFAMLGKIFASLPFGELAWRLNLFSLVCGVAAAVMLQRAAARWSGSAWAGFLAAACFAFSPVVWEHAVGAEVFALHHVIVAALLWVAVLYADTAAPRWVWIGAGIAALGASHHHTIVFVAAPLVVWPLIRQPAYWWKAGRLCGLAAIGLAGLLPYLWLVMAANNVAPVSWGDPTSWQGFVHHFTRAEYGTLQLAAGEVSSSGGWWDRMRAWFWFQGTAMGWLGLMVVVMGAVAAIRSPRWRVLGIGIVASYVFYIMVFNYLANLSPEEPLIHAVLVRFWTMPHLMACALLAVGWAWIWKRKARMEIAGALLAGVLAIGWNWQKADRRGAGEFAHYGASWLESLPQGAVLLARGDLIVNTIQYRQIGTGLRPDVRVLDLERMTYVWHARTLKKWQPDLVLPDARYHLSAADGYDLGELIRANPQLGPWFVAGDLTAQELARLPGWSVRAHGVGWRLVAPGESFDFETWWRESEQYLPKHPLPSKKRREVDPWAVVVVADFEEARHRRAVVALEYGMANPQATAALRKAAGEFEEIVRSPDAPARVYKNLGLAWQRLESQEPAHPKTRAKEAWRKFLELDQGKDRDAAAIRQWVDAP